jgi:hypothetical protein
MWHLIGPHHMDWALTLFNKSLLMTSFLVRV